VASRHKTLKDRKTLKFCHEASLSKDKLDTKFKTKQSSMAEKSKMAAISISQYRGSNIKDIAEYFKALKHDSRECKRWKF
jgi:nitric oxide reductase large subunit